MGMMYSCPGADCAFDRSFDALYNRSISFHGDNAPGAAHSTSFKGCSDTSIIKALGSGKMMIEGSLSFKRRDLDPYNIETKFSIRASDMDMEDVKETSDFKSPKTESAEQSVQLALVSETSSPKHKAAVKLQKVYKSFRTRRKLADCAVLVEQRWWKLLDYALLNGSSVSYFDIKKAESVISRWARARTKAAKVGKGLSKDGKARKLAVEHWLEAIDPRHRYGHNLRFYYVHWLRCESRQPFFYWLDIGEGKEVNLEQHCPRWKLQQQCIKYLGPKEREAYEVEVEDGKLLYKQTRQLLDTPEDKLDTKWIFVLSASRNLYVGQKKKGTFQHSSFLAGGATSAAGRLAVTNGVLKAVWPHSGHYRPTEENFQELETFLMENNVDLSNVKRSPSDEVELQAWKKDSVRSSSSNSDLVGTAMMENGSSMLDDEAQENTSSGMGSRADGPLSGYARGLSNNSIDLKFLAGNQNLGSETVKDHPAFDQIYTQYSHDLFREFEGDSEEESDSKTDEMEQTGTIDKPQTDGEVGSYNKPQTDGDQTGELETSEQRYIYQKHNLFVEEPSDNEEDTVPNEKIIQRINSKKGMKSFQLGKQLSFKWTTGAGPRIGWVRDYPSELQFHALEQVNLSPRGARTPRAVASPRITTLSPRPPNLS